MLVKKGQPAQVIQAWREQRYLLVTSNVLINEIIHTLGYARIRRKYHITDDDVADLTVLLKKDALVVPGTANVWGTVIEDPDDDHVLACAVDGQADVIVSGDHHLLKLGEYRQIPIVSARDFLQELSERE
ncbi:MAG: putative toxin-antitoxin system toxin component, PIN family [Chloroflexi bacterium]|nr:putative toxin-antitoxin system toxin component, PIN family [Chloroflexota bacterium]